MYVVSRNMKVGKDISRSVIEEFSAPSVMNRAEGFIRREVLVNTETEDFNSIKVLYYWKDKDSLKKWHASKEHKEMHVQRKNSGKSQTDRTSLNMTFEEFELVATLKAE
jgi:Uncharacterized enzyme involved in biosynthesis of extracellular polysaccharides